MNMKNLQKLAALATAFLTATTAFAQAPATSSSGNTSEHRGAAPASGPTGNVPDPLAASIEINQYTAVFPNDKSADFGPFAETGMAFLAGERTLDSLPKVRTTAKDFVLVNVFTLDNIIAWEDGGSRLGFPFTITSSEPTPGFVVKAQIESADVIDDVNRPSGLHFIPVITTYSPTFVGRQDGAVRKSGPVDQTFTRLEYIGAAVGFGGLKDNANQGIRDWVNSHHSSQNPYWVRSTVSVMSSDGKTVIKSDTRTAYFGAPQGRLTFTKVGQHGAAFNIVQPGGVSVFIEEAPTPYGPWTTTGQAVNGNAISVNTGGNRFFRTRQ